MPFKPENVIGEVLGVRAKAGVDPSATKFICPFIDSRCIKRSTANKSEPYPVCSIWQKSNQALQAHKDLICVCPKRFYAVDFLKDVVTHCWPGKPPANPKVAPEVKMTGFGNVDFVIADMGSDGSVGQFLSVELQAIDITGSVAPAYEALRQSKELAARPSYGLNWDNVYKRYITQLIRKGYFHHHWKSKIVAVMQDHVYQNIVERADFLRSGDVKSDTVNIIFMAYRYEDDPDHPGEFRLVLSKVEGTSHANLQQAILYKEPPSRDEFCKRIKASAERADLASAFKVALKDVDLSDL